MIPRLRPAGHTWLVWAGTGMSTDALDGFMPAHLTIHAGDSVTWQSGGAHFHTVSFGIDPRTVPPFVPAGMSAKGPILAFNPKIVAPVVPKGGMYMGGIASSGIYLPGNYLNMFGGWRLTVQVTAPHQAPVSHVFVLNLDIPASVLKALASSSK